MNKPLIDQFVDRFLAWKLPEDFSPDCGIAFKPIPNASPVGTNLLTATQAKAMLEHIVGELIAEHETLKEETAALLDLDPRHQL